MPSPSDLRSQFRAIFRSHVSGVTVVTYADGAELGGFTATSVISVSAEPPTIAFAVSAGSTSGQALVRADSVVVNFLDDAHSEVATRFATRGAERFIEGGHDVLATGEPVLAGSSGWLRAEVRDRLPVNDSLLIVGTVVEVDARTLGAEDLRPLVYLNRRYRRLAPED